ncbi:uncharacterized protein [Palaemon carinicauda]|uniref:uncharacterized protein isoform X1 n=1 Tax=Palaemon carinicauda TaxID=392227 RepID=UPI0035B6A733
MAELKQAEQIYEDVQASLKALYSIHDKMKSLLAEVRQSLVQSVESRLGVLQQGLQKFFISRNEKLEIAVNEVQDNLKQAEESKEKIFSFREEIVKVFNASVKSPLISSEGDFQCGDYGEENLKEIFIATEESFGKLNNIQEHYASILAEVCLAIPHMIDSTLQEFEMVLSKRNAMLQQWAELQVQKIKDDLSKCRQSTETLQDVKHRMDSLLSIINKNN